MINTLKHYELCSILQKLLNEANMNYKESERHYKLVLDSPADYPREILSVSLYHKLGC